MESATKAKIIVLMLLLASGAVFIDGAGRAPLFPDAVYCLAGAGTFVTEPATTKPTSWQVNPGGPDIPDSWTTTPEQVDCVHERLWDGWKKRYEARFGPLKLPTLSVTAPKACRINGSSQFAEWFNGSLMAKPQLAKAFGRCLDAFSSIQDKFLTGLEDEAASTTSNSTRASLLERARTVKSRLELDRGAACLKLALASLRLGESPPDIPDQLANLERVFLNGPWQGYSRSENLRAPDDVTQMASRKLDDLTSAGMAELAEKMAFADVKNPAFLRKPIFLLPSIYGGNQYTMGFESPKLNKWAENVSLSMECH